MCGGVFTKLNRIPKKELEKRFSEKEIQKFEKNGGFESFFWSQMPLLPVENNETVELVAWGNRDAEVELPKTGWAKKESIDIGKWAYLKPTIVKIPVDKGFEKGVWFEPNGDFQGLRVNKDGKDRVYMITKNASEEYLKLTKHNRQPVEVEKKFDKF